jgi:hypothetical protein
LLCRELPVDRVIQLRREIIVQFGQIEAGTAAEDEAS